MGQEIKTEVYGAKWTYRKRPKRSKIRRPLLVAVIQGGNNFELRKQSAEELQEIGFDIYGFGGLPLHNTFSWKNDAPSGFYHELLENVTGLVPKDSIKYGLGIGTPDDIAYCAHLGWDIFDTVLPTRNARHGLLYVSKGMGDKQHEEYDTLHIRTKGYEYEESPIAPSCDCEACRSISRAYLRYLLKINEPAGYRFASIHNLRFYSILMNRLQSELSSKKLS
jgi:queuine tRNA-ribosyltransferase